MSYVTVLILEDTTSSSVYYTTECSWAHSRLQSACYPPSCVNALGGGCSTLKGNMAFQRIDFNAQIFKHINI